MNSRIWFLPYRYLTLRLQPYEKCTYLLSRHAKKINSVSRCFCSWTPEEISVSIDSPLEVDEFTPEEAVDVNIEEITGGDADKLRNFHMLRGMINLMREEGKLVPHRINVTRWKLLLSLKSTREVEVQLKTFWYTEYLKRKKKDDKVERRDEDLLGRQRKKELTSIMRSSTNLPLVYGLCGVTLFEDVRDKRMYKYHNCKVAQASWFGPDILIDCGYESYMNDKSVMVCAKQMIRMWTDNRLYGNPFHIIYCNVDLNSRFVQLMRKQMASIPNADFLMDIRADHYTDIYDKKKLVYLTPDSMIPLKQYNPQDIYIIGALADSSRNEAFSLAKAKKEGLRMAKLPLHLHVPLGKGIITKSLMMNEVLTIMNEVKNGYPWSYAFRKLLANKSTAKIEKFYSEAQSSKSNCSASIN